MTLATAILALALSVIGLTVSATSRAEIMNPPWPLCQSTDRYGRVTRSGICGDDELNKSINGRVVDGEWVWNGPQVPIDDECGLPGSNDDCIVAYGLYHDPDGLHPDAAKGCFVAAKGKWEARPASFCVAKLFGLPR